MNSVYHRQYSFLAFVVILELVLIVQVYRSIGRRVLTRLIFWHDLYITLFFVTNGRGMSFFFLHLLLKEESKYLPDNKVNEVLPFQVLNFDRLAKQVIALTCT